MTRTFPTTWLWWWIFWTTLNNQSEVQHRERHTRIYFGRWLLLQKNALVLWAYCRILLWIESSFFLVRSEISRVIFFYCQLFSSSTDEMGVFTQTILWRSALFCETHIQTKLLLEKYHFMHWQISRWFMFFSLSWRGGFFLHKTTNCITCRNHILKNKYFRRTTSHSFNRLTFDQNHEKQSSIINVSNHMFREQWIHLIDVNNMCSLLEKKASTMHE